MRVEKPHQSVRMIALLTGVDLTIIVSEFY